MAKTSVDQWSGTASDNTDVGGIDIDENCAAANVNNAMREIMAQVVTDVALKTSATTISGAWTYTGAVTMTTNVTFGDLDELRFGASDDMVMYHNGGATNILNSNANALQLRSDISISMITSGATETMAVFTKDGSVDLYYDNTKTFETTAAGVTVTGALTTTGAFTPASITTTGAITADSFTPTAQTVTATTSGTEHDYTGIPSTATKIELMLDGVSWSGNDPLSLVIGDAGGFETSGYSGAVSEGTAATANSAKFLLTKTNNASYEWSGLITLIKLDGNTWSVGGGLSRGWIINLSAGAKTLSAALTQIRLTTDSGTDTFDAGQFNIRYS